jgi:tetratricopeptide (TPR) repeat protein
MLVRPALGSGTTEQRAPHVSRSHFLDKAGNALPSRRRPCRIARRPQAETVMITSRSLAAVLLFSSALIAPDLAAAAGEESPSPPPQTQTAPSHSMKKGTHTKKKDTMQRNSSAEDFLDGYHAAWALIYDKGDYAAGMAALHALGYDDNADVATLLGYASRKLGRYDEAKFWYERALAADPNHAVTWSYYGMWQAEQGNLLKAKDDLEKVRVICGNTDCRPYRMLSDVIDGTVTY